MDKQDPTQQTVCANLTRLPRGNGVYARANNEVSELVVTAVSLFIRIAVNYAGVPSEDRSTSTFLASFDSKLKKYLLFKCGWDWFLCLSLGHQQCE